MKLYSDSTGALSHRTRIVLAEKGVAVDIVDALADSLPEDILAINPYHTLPVLVDRDLALFNSMIIMEYLDERFPHPPLMPVDPVSRANARLMLYRIDEDWYKILHLLEPGRDGKPRDSKQAKEARKVLADGLTSLSPLLVNQSFLFGEQFTLVDCSIAPLLWRLRYFGISLSKSSAPLQAYAGSLFSRDGFRASVTDLELEMQMQKSAS